MNRVIKTPSGESAEIDVKGKRGGILVVAECKGFGPGKPMTEEVLKDWIERQVPRIREWHGREVESRHADGAIEFQFYFSGDFDPEIQKYCDELKANRRKYKIEFFDYGDISRRLKTVNEHGALRTLNDFFRTPPPLDSDIFQKGV